MTNDQNKPKVIDPLAIEAISEEQFVIMSNETGMDVLRLKVLLKTYGKGLSPLEFMLFVNKAKQYELSIERGELRAYKDNNNNLVMFAGRDGFLNIGQRSPDFRSINSMEVRENDEFWYDIFNETVTHNPPKEGDRGKIIGAYAVVKRLSGGVTIEYAENETYDKDKFVWKSHKKEMIKKVAEVHALKKAFGISGLYAIEEKDSMNLPEDPGTGTADTLTVMDVNAKIEACDTIESLDNLGKEIGTLGFAATQIKEVMTNWAKKKQALIIKDVK